MKKTARLPRYKHVQVGGGFKHGAGLSTGLLEEGIVDPESLKCYVTWPDPCVKIGCRG